MEMKGTQNCQKNLEKEKTGKLRLPCFQSYYKVRVIKSEVWNKDKNIDKWNITESPDINFYIYDQLIFF